MERDIRRESSDEGTDYQQNARLALSYIERSGVKEGAPQWVTDLISSATHLDDERGADMSSDGWRWQMIHDVLAGIAKVGSDFDVSELVPQDPQYVIAWMASSPTRIGRCTDVLQYLPCENPGIERWIRRIRELQITDLIELAYLDELTGVAAAARSGLRCCGPGACSESRPPA